MNFLINKSKTILTPKEVDISCVTVVYKSEKSGLWRGFIAPYDVTYESEDKNKVIEVLKNMASSYREGLEKHNFPTHLSDVPLYDLEDRNKMASISLDQIIKDRKLETPDLYVSTTLFA